MTNHPEEAWECYLQTEDSRVSYQILKLIGNEYYKMGNGQYLFSAQSFGELLKIDSHPDYLDGLTGAGVGYFNHTLSAKWHTHKNEGPELKMSKNDSEKLIEVVNILESSSLPKGDKIASTIRAWAVQNQALHS